MKKIILIILLILAFSFSCNNQKDEKEIIEYVPIENEIEHTHDFSLMVEEDKFLCQKGDCETPSTYYYSCECGASSTKTFASTNVSSHNFVLISEVSATYFEKGEKIYECSFCHTKKTEEEDTIPFPETSIALDNLDNMVNGIVYTISGIVVSLNPLTIKCENQKTFILTIIDGETFNLNDFIVVTGDYNSNNETLSYCMLRQVNDEIYYETHAENTLTITEFSSGSYQTGNFGNLYLDSYEFSYTRTYNSTLINSKNYKYDCLPGTFKNTIGFGDIEYLTITYNCESSFLIGYSEDLDTYEYITVDSGKASTKDIYLNKADYFTIETKDCDVTIESLVIHYYNKEKRSFVTKYTGTGEYRLNLSSYEGTLIPGVSQVTYPTKVEYLTSSTYQVLETKTYTYYTLEYIQNNPALKEASAMTDPIDVINYYYAFREIPANYEKAKNFKKVFAVYGTLAREYSVYSRTDGYVNYVPFNGGSYYEFDIDLDGSYVSNTGSVNRGVGRVVMFLNGFKNDGYNDFPQAVFTDNHYQTFQEYYNDGSFSKRFNVEGIYCCYAESAAISLTYKDEKQED